MVAAHMHYVQLIDESFPNADAFFAIRGIALTDQPVGQLGGDEASLVDHHVVRAISNVDSLVGMLCNLSNFVVFQLFLPCFDHFNRSLLTLLYTDLSQFNTINFTVCCQLAPLNQLLCNF